MNLQAIPAKAIYGMSAAQFQQRLQAIPSNPIYLCLQEINLQAIPAKAIYGMSAAQFQQRLQAIPSKAIYVRGKQTYRQSQQMLSMSVGDEPTGNPSKGYLCLQDNSSKGYLCLQEINLQAIPAKAIYVCRR